MFRKMLKPFGYAIALSLITAAAQQPQINLKFTLAGHKKRVTAIAFSPDENSLATGSDDGLVRLWSMNDGKLKAEFPSHKDGVYQLVFGPSGKTVAVSSKGESAIQLWNAERGNLHTTLPGLTGKKIELRLSNYGQTLAGVTDQGFVLWEIETGKLIGTTGKLAQKQEDFQFNATGNRITTKTGKGIINLWDATNGQLIAELPVQSKRREMSDYPYLKEPKPSFWLKAVFSPNGKQIVTTCGDWAAELWDTNDGKLLAVLDGHETQARSSYPMILETLGGKPVIIPDEIHQASFSPDYRLIATFANGSAKFWDAQTGSLRATMKARTRVSGHLFEGRWFAPYHEVNEASSEKLHRALLWAEEHYAWQIIFSQDKKTMVTSHPNNKGKAKIMLYDVEAGNVRMELPMFYKLGFFETLLRRDVISFSFGGKVLVANNEKSVRLFDLAGGKVLLELEHGGLPTASSSSGKLFAVARKTGEVQLYSLGVR